MSDTQSITQTRKTLYEEVWKEPMTTVAKRYSLSDNGIRKRCKSLNIPFPSVGYWAKVKAGKPVGDRPPLPPYNATTLNYVSQNDNDSVQSQSARKSGLLELQDLDEFTVAQIENMHGLDLLLETSKKVFIGWCNSLSVPGKISFFDEQISRHKQEMEYRTERDKEYPFRNEHIDIRKPFSKVKDHDNSAVIPIEVSERQQNRAYRIADTLLKAFRQIKANISVERGNKDNIQISLLNSAVNFAMYECKTKRRHLIHAMNTQDFRPLYEDVYDGRLQINWEIHCAGYCYHSKAEPPVYLSFIDAPDKPLESQISTIFIEIYTQCCNKKISDELERKKSALKYERERNEQAAKEQAENLRKLEEKRRARRDDLITGIDEQANNWFKHEKLSRYADELEAYLPNCTDIEDVQILQKYIALVRKNVDNYNPLNHILQEMRAIEAED